MEQLIQQYGIVGLAAFLAADKLVYAFLRKKDRNERGSVESTTSKAIEAMSRAITDLNKHFEGVNFRQMEMEIHWLKETHAATDTTGRLRWYDRSGELKETMLELKEEIRILGNKIERIASAR